MADKNFKVKSGLNIPITSAAILTTDSNGNISSTTILPIANGGTGQTSANNALNALLPLQTGNANYFLQTNATNTQWSKAYYQSIQNNGTTVNPRGILNVVGASFTDSAGSDLTTLTFPLNTYMRQSFTPTDGQTSFTLSTAQIIGAEQVFLNGIMLVRGTDYTTPNSTTITLAAGAYSGDSLEVVTLNNISSAGTLANYKQEINTSISANTTLVAGYRYFVDTSAARTLTLPASPSVGDEIQIFDASGTAGTNNITINSNSGKINGVVQDLILDANGAVAILTYTGSTYGWRF